MENIPIQKRRLGRTNVIVPAMGVGTMLWLSNKPSAEDDIMKTYTACVDNGLSFFDTAEIYGNGKSETIIGKCIKKDGRSVMLASKYAPPSKMIPQLKRKGISADSPRALMQALDDSMSRLGINCIDLYQIHAPPSKNTIADYMDVMAEAVKLGKIRAVGVCNFSESQIREAHTALSRFGIPLASAMVGYNLLRRWPETNGVFKTCLELEISLIPYAPLAEGILTGKYRNGKRKIPIGYVVVLYFGHLNITKDRDKSVSFLRQLFSRPRELNQKKLEPLFCVMEEIANTHGKTIAQVAINWFLSNENICIIPIPGMKNVQQVNDNIGALNWNLTKEERFRIEKAELESRN